MHRGEEAGVGSVKKAFSEHSMSCSDGEREAGSAATELLDFWGGFDSVWISVGTLLSSHFSLGDFDSSSFRRV